MVQVTDPTRMQVYIIYIYIYNSPKKPFFTISIFLTSKVITGKVSCPFTKNLMPHQVHPSSLYIYHDGGYIMDSYKIGTDDWPLMSLGYILIPILIAIR